jgi:hypothetical protein
MLAHLVRWRISGVVTLTLAKARAAYAVEKYPPDIFLEPYMWFPTSLGIYFVRIFPHLG